MKVRIVKMVVIGTDYSNSNFGNCEKVLYKHLNDTVTQCAETFDRMIDWYKDCYHLEVSETDYILNAMIIIRCNFN